MREDHPILDWQDGVPVSRAFDDPYFSFADGLEETRHVFLKGNGLPGRFAPGFHIAELGFGTGLNAFAALALWRAAGRTDTLRFTSFEKYPMRPDHMRRALSAYPAIAALATQHLELFEQSGTWSGWAEGLKLKVIVGDARDTLPDWAGRADAWFLDGFAPAKNPELWEPSLLTEVARHTAPGGTAATYSAAGAVRRGLAGAGFAVVRVPGYGRKRHMTMARLT